MVGGGEGNEEKEMIISCNSLLMFLQNHTLLLSLWRWSRAKNGTDCFVKDVLKTLLCQGRAFEIFDSTNLFLHLQALRVRNRCHVLLAEFCNRFWIFPKIEFGANQDHRCIGSVMTDFRIPLNRYDTFSPTCIHFLIQLHLPWS